MRGFWKLTKIELKLYFRFPVMAIITLAVPVMILLLVGSIFGNLPSTLFGGFGAVDVAVPAYTAMIIAIGTFLTVPIALSNYRERGILRRFRTTPVHRLTLLGVQMLLQFIVTLLGMLLLILIGELVFGIRFEGRVVSYLLSFSLSCLSFFSFGLVLGSLLPNVRVANLVGNVLLLPMIYLSGATIPNEVMSPELRSFQRFIPLSHVVSLLQGLWVGDAWSAHQTELVVLGCILVVSIIIAVMIFRWE